MARVKTAIFISGGGSNMAALINAARAEDYPAEIVLVVSNEPDAGGLAKAEAAGINTRVVDHRAFSDRAAFDSELDATARAVGADIICLAGFMRLLTAPFIDAWRDKLVNIHPALLPSFKGLHTHQRALDAGVRFHGCTVHLVRTDMDAGPILIQAAVPVMAGDTAESLAARVLIEEHKIYPRALAWLAAGRISVDDADRARINDADALSAPASLIHPSV